MFFSKALIDRDTFLEVVGNEAAMVDTVIELYKEQTENGVKSINKAIDTADFLLLERAAHDLKNVGRNIASEKLVEQAHELEIMGANKDVESAIDKLDSVERMLNSALKELLAIRKSLSRA